MKLESEWMARREQLCLHAGVTNLNAGSCSPTCRPAFAALLALTRAQAEDPVEFIFRQAPILTQATRAALAGVIAAPPADLLLFNNTTYGVNTVARALRLSPGDDIVLSGEEYHHFIKMWERIAAETGARLVPVAVPTPAEAPGLTSADLVARFAAAMTGRTRVLFFSHVISSTGLVLPAAALCQLARARGVTSVVDGAHALGLIPVSLAEIRPDYYAASLQKWMMGPVGSAALYVAPERQAATPPLITTGSYAYDRARATEEVAPGGPSRWTFSHEYQGTRDYAPLLAAAAAVRFHGEVPLAVTAERWRHMAAYGRARLSALGLVPASHAAPELATCLVAFVVPTPGGRRLDAALLGPYLRRVHGIEVAFPCLTNGQPLLRISAAWFNTEAEIDALTAVLAGLDWASMA